MGYVVTPTHFAVDCCRMVDAGVESEIDENSSRF